MTETRMMLMLDGPAVCTARDGNKVAVATKKAVYIITDGENEEMDVLPLDHAPRWIGMWQDDILVHTARHLLRYNADEVWKVPMPKETRIRILVSGGTPVLHCELGGRRALYSIESGKLIKFLYALASTMAAAPAAELGTAAAFFFARVRLAGGTASSALAAVVLGLAAAAAAGAGVASVGAERGVVGFGRRRLVRIVP